MDRRAGQALPRPMHRRPQLLVRSTLQVSQQHTHCPRSDVIPKPPSHIHVHSMVSGEICATTAQKVRGMCGPAEGTASIDGWRGSFVCDVLTIPRAHFVLCNVFCTGYFPGNGHEYCWPCAKTATANTFLLIGGSILIFSLWGLLSFGITSRSVGILLNFLQVTNMIQVLL